MHIFNVIILIISILFLYYYKPISKYINLLDVPDKKRKIHLDITPKSGGIIVLLFAINYFLSNYYNQEISLKLFFSLIISLIIIFSIFLIDDLVDINPILRLFLVGFILFILFISNDQILINELRFSSFEMSAQLDKSALFFSVLCVLLLINAINLIDGINGLCIAHFLFWLVILDTNLKISQLIIYIPLIFLFILNIKGKIFLGNTGSVLIGLMISILIITQYNFEKNIYIEEIFIYLMVPGLDMLRLFVKRLLNKKNPFLADKNHLHHLLYFRYKLFISLILYLIISLVPIVISYLVDDHFLIIIISVTILIYLTIIYKLENFRN